MPTYIFKILMSVFLVICIGVHVVGVVSPLTGEPLWSHIVHMISYAICLVSVLRPFSWRWVAYTIGAVYPFMYHARCAWTQFAIFGRYSAVCILVVVLLPTGIWLVWPKGPKTD